MEAEEGEAREEPAPRADVDNTSSSRPVTPQPRLAAQASAGSSPSHPTHGRGPPSLRAVSVQAPSQADSFIMGFLRGWRPLQAASPSASWSALSFKLLAWSASSAQPSLAADGGLAWRVGLERC